MNWTNTQLWGSGQVSKKGVGCRPTQSRQNVVYQLSGFTITHPLKKMTHLVFRAKSILWSGARIPIKAADTLKQTDKDMLLSVETLCQCVRIRSRSWSELLLILENTCDGHTVINPLRMFLSWLSIYHLIICQNLDPHLFSKTDCETPQSLIPKIFSRAESFKNLKHSW